MKDTEIEEILFSFQCGCVCLYRENYFNKSTGLFRYHARLPEEILFLSLVRHICAYTAQQEARDSSKMLEGRGYCTQPSCFPVLGAPPIQVFLCQTHCGHMLCYRHWLSHQTGDTILINERKHMAQPASGGQIAISVVTLESDSDEQEDVPDLLKEFQNQSIQSSKRDGMVDRMKKDSSMISRLDSGENKPQM